MYTSHNLAIKIKETAKSRNIVIKQMLIDCELGSNTMSALYHGKSIAFDSLARIADYLDCSVDYLLGRTDTPLTENEQLLLDIIRELDDDKKQLLFETAKAMAEKNT